jgi:two-component system LytT family response regulator
MIRCIIVDDEQPAIDVLRYYIGRIPTLELLAAFTDPLQALQFLNETAVDLLFLDIQMPELSGLDLVKAIRGRSKVILTTAYSEFVSEGYELEVADYLLKPIPFPRFLKAVQRVHIAAAPVASIDAPIASPNPNEEAPIPDDYFFVKTELKGKVLKINIRDIDFVESMNNYIAIHHGGTKTIAYLNMKDLEERLPSRYFMRIHRSYIIALEKIVAIEGNTIHLHDIAQGLQLGDTYRPAFLERMKGRLLQ